VRSGRIGFSCHPLDFCFQYNPIVKKRSGLLCHSNRITLDVINFYLHDKLHGKKTARRFNEEKIAVETLAGNIRIFYRLFLTILHDVYYI